MTFLRNIAFVSFVAIVSMCATAEDYIYDHWVHVINPPLAANTEWSFYPIYLSNGWRIPRFISASDMAWSLECAANRLYTQDDLSGSYNYNYYKNLSSANIAQVFSMIDNVRGVGQHGKRGWVRNESNFREIIPWTGNVGDNTITDIFGNYSIYTSGFTDQEKTDFTNSVSIGKILRSSHFKNFIFDKMNGINDYVVWEDLSDYWEGYAWYRKSGDNIIARAPYRVINDSGTYRFPYYFNDINPGACVYDNSCIIYEHCSYADGTKHTSGDDHCREMEIGYFTYSSPEMIRFNTSALNKSQYDSYRDSYLLIEFTRFKTNWDNGTTTKTTRFAVIKTNLAYKGQYWNNVFSGPLLERLRSIAETNFGIIDDVSLPPARSERNYGGHDAYVIKLVGYCLGVHLNHSNLNY